MRQTLYKSIVIIGPTASGKSDLAIAIAKQYDGEIVSADSRQVYRGMDKGTGKVNRDDAQMSKSKFQISKRKNDYYSEGIRHHLIDVASPRREYNVSHFLRDAKKSIADIEKRGKLPIICGGTHFWVQTLLTGETLPEVTPDKNLRAELDKKSTETLSRMLEEKDPKRAETIDKKNKYRLIRALEIIGSLGAVPAPIRHPASDTRYPACIIAMSPDKEILRERIRIRLEKRFDEGMIEEVQRLRANGISFKRLESFGLEYRYIALFLQGKISETEMREQLFFEIWHYAKRQLSFIRRMEKHGLTINSARDTEHALRIISKQRFRPDKTTL
jgi:tRNA dimethylallyltransferase